MPAHVLVGGYSDLSGLQTPEGVAGLGAPPWWLPLVAGEPVGAVGGTPPCGAVRAPSQHGSWLPPETVSQGGARSSAVSHVILSAVLAGYTGFPFAPWGNYTRKCGSSGARLRGRHSGLVVDPRSILFKHVIHY